MRYLIWEELAGIFSWWSFPWVVGGDFNVVCFPLERLGAENFTQVMHNFSDFISSHGLLDTPLEDDLYTWSTSSSSSRLDQFLFSHHWDVYFPYISQRRLPIVLSGQFPILLGGRNQQKGRQPFGFENTWLKAEGFMEKVKS